jgi:hypothetical protein
LLRPLSTTAPCQAWQLGRVLVVLGLRDFALVLASLVAT